MGLTEVSWNGLDWIYLNRERNIVVSCDSDLETSCSVGWEEFLVNCGNIGVSKWSLLNRVSYIVNIVYCKLVL
jgi:hypothetical protein